jgi:site-specific DNA recombinase
MMQRHMPIGYKLVEGKIQFDEPKAAAVKKVFADYLSGTATHAIAKQLTKMKFLNANNKASWNHESLLESRLHRQDIGECQILGRRILPADD